MSRKYLIYAPSYNENNGGCIVQHKLCSILNGLGHEAYLHPCYTRFFEIEKNNYHLSIKALIGFARRVIFRLIEDYLKYKKYKVNPAFNTPVFDQKNIIFDDGWIVIYPEITFGNPLKAKNVVRWLLHQPGFHTGRFFYEKNELIIKFNSAIKDFEHTGSTTLSNELKVIHYPTEFYNMNGVIPEEKKGIAYCVRKGKNKPIQHDLTDSVLIDGKTHKDIAAIFKRVNTFISYDTYTAYSFFAVLCGCDSIVIPDKGVTKEQWYPNPKDRYGLAYGVDDLENARSTAHLVKSHIEKEEKQSIDNVREFVIEVNKFF